MTAITRHGAAPTLIDVARAAGVSVSTAGRVLRDSGWPVDAALKERVRAAASQLGYVPNMLARTLRAGGPALVGLVVGNMLDPYYAEIAEAVTQHAEASHTMLAMVCNMQRDPMLELKYCRQLWEHRVAGLILPGGGFDQLTHQAEFAAILDQMARSGVVVTTLSPRAIDAPVFCVDNRTVGRIAAAELIAHGHRCVGIATGPTFNELRRQRLDGTIATLKEAGASCHIARQEPDEEPGASVVAMLRDNPRITGLIASTHMISRGIVNAARQAGRAVPDDISVVAIGNVRLAAWSTPRLTYVDLNLDACGRAALDYIAARVGGKSVEPAPIQPPRLIRGESVIAVN